MSYLSDWKEAEDAERAARAANPNCDQSATCPAPDDGHLVGCRRNRQRLGLLTAPATEKDGGGDTKGSGIT